MHRNEQQIWRKRKLEMGKRIHQLLQRKKELIAAKRATDTFAREETRVSKKVKQMTFYLISPYAYFLA
jgi:vacuolar-type H+-ATPase subunit D/Vma8